MTEPGLDDPEVRARASSFVAAIVSTKPWVADLRPVDRQLFVDQAEATLLACTAEGIFADFADLIRDWQAVSRFWAGLANPNPSRDA